MFDANNITDDESVSYQAGVYGPVRPTDHLWTIAKAVRPSRQVTLQQTMLALLNKNHDAFTITNVNSLREGVVLRLPSLREIQRISPLRAEIQVARQNRLWQKLPSVQARQVSRLRQHQHRYGHQHRHRYGHQHQHRHHGHHYSHRVDHDDHHHLAGTGVGMGVGAGNRQAVLQEVLRFERETKARLKKIETQTSQLKNQVLYADRALVALTKAVVNAGKTLETKPLPLVSSVSSVSSPSTQSFQYKSFYPVSALFFVGLVFLGLLLVWRSKMMVGGSRRVAVVDDKGEGDWDNQDESGSRDDRDDQEAEYDYLGSSEGILAKFDLARAYIDMGEEKLASDTLSEIIAQGSEAQKKEAKALLSTLKAK